MRRVRYETASSLILTFTQIHCYSVQFDDSHLTNTVRQALGMGKVSYGLLLHCMSLYGIILIVYSCMYLLLIGYCSITICRTMQRVSYWTASSLLAFISQTIRFFGFSSSFTIDFQFYTSCHRFLELQCAWLHFSNNIDKGNAGGQILVCFLIVIIPSLLHGSEVLVLKSVCSFYPSYCHLGTLSGLFH